LVTIQQLISQIVPLVESEGDDRDAALKAFDGVMSNMQAFAARRVARSSWTVFHQDGPDLASCREPENVSLASLTKQSSI
jgi:hypothetical protein